MKYVMTSLFNGLWTTEKIKEVQTTHVGNSSPVCAYAEILYKEAGRLKNIRNIKTK